MKIITQINLKLMQTRDDFSRNISVDEFFRKIEVLSKDIEFTITSNETNEGDTSVWDMVNFGLFEHRRRKDVRIPLILKKLKVCFAFKAAVAMTHLV